MEATPIERTGYIIFAGPRHSYGDYLYLYIELPSLDMNKPGADSKDLRIWRLDESLFKHQIIGAIYPATIKEKTIHYKKNDLPVATWQNDKEKSEWRAHEAGVKAAKKLKTDLLANPMLESLQPIREAYKQASIEGKRGILAEVIRAITT